MPRPRGLADKPASTTCSRAEKSGTHTHTHTHSQTFQVLVGARLFALELIHFALAVRGDRGFGLLLRRQVSLQARVLEPNGRQLYPSRMTMAGFKLVNGTKGWRHPSNRPCDIIPVLQTQHARDTGDTVPRGKERPFRRRRPPWRPRRRWAAPTQPPRVQPTRARY